MIEVYHIEQSEHLAEVSFGYGDESAHYRAVSAAWAAGAYEKVAEIATDDLEVAWRLTNSVDSSWSMEPDQRVKVTAPLHVVNGETYGRRSSMIGDVFIKGGEKHVVAMLGFRRIEMPIRRPASTISTTPRAGVT